MSAQRRRLVRGGGVASFALVVGFVVAVVWVPRSTVLDGVEVLTDAEPLRCSGAAVDTWTPPSEQFTFQVAELRPGMDCRLRFFIDNTTPYDVTLEEIVIPVLGAGGGAGAEVTMLNPTRSSGRWAPSGEIDAVFDVDQRISAGELSSFEAVIEFRDDGCSSPDATMSLHVGSWPTATVRFRGMDLELDSAAASFGFRGTGFSDCDTSPRPSDVAAPG